MRYRFNIITVLVLMVIHLVLGIVLINYTEKHVWIDNGGQYIYSCTDNLGKFNSTDGKVIEQSLYSDNINFVVTLRGYGFDELAEYEYYGTYESPIIIVTKNATILDEIDYHDFISAILNDGSYFDLGIKNTKLSGVAKYRFCGTDNEKDLLRGFIERLDQESGVKLRKSAISSSTIRSNQAGIGVQFRCSDIGWTEVPSNLPHVSLVVDIYRRLGTDYELGELVGFNRVTGDISDSGIIDIIDLVNSTDYLN